MYKRQIHDTSSVVGAGAAYGEEALKVATTIKLTRALWIIPMAFATSFIFKSCLLYTSLEIMGIPVYISDTEAKRITCTDTVIRRELCASVGQEVFQGGELNRTLLAEYMFGYGS